MTRELPPVIASAVETEHFLQRKEQSISDRARLLALFDAASECSCDVTVREWDEPEAATQLVLWASARRKTWSRNDGEGWRTIEVEIATAPRRAITAYLHAERTGT